MRSIYERNAQLRKAKQLVVAIPVVNCGPTRRLLLFGDNFHVVYIADLFDFDDPVLIPVVLNNFVICVSDEEDDYYLLALQLVVFDLKSELIWYAVSMLAF